MNGVAVAFPVVGWEGIIGEQPFCLMRFAYIRTEEEGAAVRAGSAPPIVPLGFTAEQCRKLALDLVKAADALEGRERAN